MMSAELISQNLKVQRAIKGLSQKGLASMCNLTQAQVSKLETNSYKHGNIPIAVKQKVLKVLESDISASHVYRNGALDLKSFFKIEEGVNYFKTDNELIEQLLIAIEILVKVNANYHLKILRKEGC